MGKVEVSKFVIASIRTNCSLDTSCLTEHVEDMNEEIEKNIQKNEYRIAMGLRKAQSIQAR